jgi:peptidoglycan/LPS O-acetylase OafA/YrhL
MTPPPRLKISASTSIVLDVLRIMAALVVVVFHASGQWTTAFPAAHAALGKASHAAVVVFFVISGYVIAFTTATNNRGPRQYAVARLSRLYSIMGPALVLTAMVEAVVTHTNAELTTRYVREYSGVRYLLTAVFGNESGFVSAAPPLNSPLWSLSYEFWYYVLFGIWFYYGFHRQALLWLVVAAIIAGPKILLLLPVWLFGVGVYRWPKPAFPAGLAWALVVGLLGLAGAAVVYVPAWPAAVGDKPLFMAGQFATDWVVGLLVALAVWSLPAGRAVAGQRWVKPLRTIADLSFPLYALHFPLLVLWRALFGERANDLQQLWQVTVGVILVAGLGGLLLDKQRGRWARFFTWASGFIRKKRPAIGAELPDC